MKQFSGVSKLAACAVAAVAALLLALPAQAVTKGQAEVKAIQGSASYTDGKGGSGSLTVGMILSEGATIITGPGAFADLFLGDNGQALRVRADSKLTLTQLEIIGAGAANTQLYLEKGGILGNVKKVSATSKYEVKTPKGVAGIRGTAFAISIGADGRPVASVLSGTVTFYFVINGVPCPPVTVTAGNSVTAPLVGGTTVTPTPTPATLQPILVVDLGELNANTTTTTTTVVILSLNQPPQPPGTPPTSYIGNTLTNTVNTTTNLTAP
jgi:hypothetical protein